ncbi:MAG: helix-turn-helix domain-containing protein [Bacteroidales bacterium]|nr:helix-turn-helix domain-containing protein [Candidatus Equimonas faecalis]
MAKGKYQEWLTDDGLLLLAGWARNGLTDEQIANNIGINVATLYRWKDEHSEICEALKKNKEVVDLEVENALLKSAMGYSYTERVPIKLKRIRQKDGQKIEEEYIEYTDKLVTVPPSNTAQIFWLKCRNAKKWSDRGAVSDDNAEKVVIIDDFT